MTIRINERYFGLCHIFEKWFETETFWNNIVGVFRMYDLIRKFIVKQFETISFFVF